MLRLILSSIIALMPTNALAYIDTTVKDFKKPESIKVQSYKYESSSIDNYIDVAADKVGSGVIGNIIGGPTGIILKVSERVFAREESQEEINN